MSEYIDIDAELGDDGIIIFHTNLRLTAEKFEEFYNSTTELEEGSPVAQALADIEGIDTLAMRDGEITITMRPEADWHGVVADVTAALKDFFL